ncbi:XRE family transcriptional regulator [Parachlamydia sp. AcF125]|uniref:helix-turn-helix domain-containing protein n=1 Tax=Parachlamydia sp. AcF125 TaxID=2795736 RepID=UPI001BC9B6BF|nr:XRE family transcriptional regulator [Parachlamydia sp. AcF125]MBS4168613.1 hypothetical protein [Parachlamydia sp. AcF125]
MDNLFGIRLNQARLAAGFSFRTLAQKVGVSATAIQKYETGRIFPSSDVLMEIANSLQISLEHLFRSQNVSLGEIKFRKKAALGVKAFKAIEFNIRDQLERRLELEHCYPIPPISPLNPNEVPLIKINSLEDIEKVALQIREDWKLGFSPIHDLIDVMENQGIRVIRLEIEEKNFDGLFAFVHEEPLIVISKYWPGDRQRFNLAHELGHFFLHDKIPADMDEEKACHRFAGAFLFPKPSVIQEFGEKRGAVEWKELSLAKYKYGLSMAAISYRLKEAQVISESYFQFLRRDLIHRGWRKKEPDPQLPPDEAHIFEQMLFHALGESYISESKAAELLNISLDQLRVFRMIDEYKQRQ